VCWDSEKGKEMEEGKRVRVTRKCTAVYLIGREGVIVRMNKYLVYVMLDGDTEEMPFGPYVLELVEQDFVCQQWNIA